MSGLSGFATRGRTHEVNVLVQDSLLSVYHDNVKLGELTGNLRNSNAHLSRSDNTNFLDVRLCTLINKIISKVITVMKIIKKKLIDIFFL